MTTAKPRKIDVILELIRQRPGITFAEIREHTNLANSSSKYIQDLIYQGFIYSARHQDDRMRLHYYAHSEKVAFETPEMKMMAACQSVSDAMRRWYRP